MVFLDVIKFKLDQKVPSIKRCRSVALITDSAGKLHILRHDGNSLGVDGAGASVLEETDHVG